MKNVAAYCRVSTDKDDQANSFESQKRYFEEYIKRNPEWELSEIYADEGLSGTNTRKRKAFNKMINDARLGRFDMIITKEVSRFARNTVDTLNYTRELKALKIGVYFALDNIDTLAPDGELRLTIMASLAQEESRKTSERVKWGQKRQMEQGVVFGRSMLGYDVNDGKLSINENGAEIVRLIFHKFACEHKGTYTIARELREAGYKTITGNAMWTNTVILKVIRNEKYCGDLVQKKTFTPDFLTHSKKYNHGEEDFVVLKNHHEPIISRELWEKAQIELDKRSPTDEAKHKHSNRYPLSGKIFCASCGDRFVSRTKKRKDGSVYKAWRCYESAQHGIPKIDSAGNHIGCDICCQIRDEDFMLAIQKVVESLNINKESIANELIGILMKVIFKEPINNYDEDSLKNKITNLNSKIDRLLDIYLSGDITKEEYQIRKKIFQNEISNLNLVIFKLHKTKTETPIYNDVIEEISANIKGMLSMSCTDETFYKNIVKKIVVYSREKMDIYLNLLPHKWQIALNLKLKPIDVEHFEHDTPISFNKERVTSLGIANLCDK